MAYMQYHRVNEKIKVGGEGTVLRKLNSERDLGVPISQDLRPREQCINARNKANRILGFISRTVTNRTSEVILRLYLVLVRPHLDYAVQFWSPYYRMDIDRLESIQRRMTKVINLSNQTHSTNHTNAYLSLKE